MNKKLPKYFHSFIGNIFLISTLILYSINLYAENRSFSIRDVSLGMPIEEGCQNVSIKSFAEDKQIVNDDASVNEDFKKKLISFGYVFSDIRNCKLKLGVPDGIKAIQSEPDTLYALDGVIVGLSYTLEDMSFTDALSMISVFERRHGKPKKSKEQIKGTMVYKYLWGNEKKGDALLIYILTDGDKASFNASLLRNPNLEKWKLTLKNNLKASEMLTIYLQQLLIDNSM
jgi:hypothetical protein